MPADHWQRSHLNYVYYTRPRIRHLHMLASCQPAHFTRMLRGSRQERKSHRPISHRFQARLSHNKRSIWQACPEGHWACCSFQAAVAAAAAAPVNRDLPPALCTRQAKHNDALNLVLWLVVLAALLSWQVWQSRICEFVVSESELPVRKDAPFKRKASAIIQVQLACCLTPAV